MRDIAVIRRIVRGASNFITISSSALSMLGPTDDVIITFVPLDVRWGTKKVMVRKGVGGSRLYNSVKIVIPKGVMEYLGLDKGEYVWARISEVVDEPHLPPFPYIAGVRSIHRQKSTHYLMVARSYFDAMVKSIGVENWSGKAYISVSIDEETVIRSVVKPRLQRFHNKPEVYMFTLHHDIVRNFTNPERLTNTKTYMVIGVLPKGYEHRVIENPPQTIPA